MCTQRVGPPAEDGNLAPPYRGSRSRTGCYFLKVQLSAFSAPSLEKEPNCQVCRERTNFLFIQRRRSALSCCFAPVPRSRRLSVHPSFRPRVPFPTIDAEDLRRGKFQRPESSVVRPTGAARHRLEPSYSEIPIKNRGSATSKRIAL